MIKTNLLEAHLQNVSKSVISDHLSRGDYL